MDFGEGFLLLLNGAYIFQLPDTRRRCVERGPRRRRRPSRGQPAQLQAVDVGRISSQPDPEAVNSGSRPDPKGRHLFLRIQCEPN